MTDTEPESDLSPSIRSVRVLTTGWAEQHKEHRFGSSLPRMWWVLTSRSWVRLPLNAFLIEHRDGLILFDTGIDPAVALDPGYIDSAIGRFLLKRIFRFHLTPDDKLGQKLRKLGVSSRNITKAVISHLHFDHVGGIADIPQADLLVSEREWAQLSEPNPEHEWILREHVEIPGANWQPVSFQATDEPLFAQFGGVFDVMGDGSMILLPTPGHTVGSMSMLLRAEGLPPILLIGDLAYEAEYIFADKLPGTGDSGQLRQTYAKVRQLKDQLPDLLIVPSHDDRAAKALQTVMRETHAAVAA